MTTNASGIEADLDRSRHLLNDTIDALGDKLTAGRVLDEGMGLLHGRAGKWTADMGRKIRDNPLPLLLIGAGAVLLFTQRQNPAGLSDEEQQHQTRFAELESARSATTRGEGEEESAWSQRMIEAEAKVLGLNQHAEESSDDFKARVKDAGDRLTKTIADLRARVGRSYKRGSEGISQGASNVTDFLGDQALYARHLAGDLKHRTQDLYNESPLAVGAVGLAAGALIGAAAPLLSVEREKLGGIARTAARQGADLAERGAQAAQGLSDKAEAAVH
jgi:hypothetical protein